MQQFYFSTQGAGRLPPIHIPARPQPQQPMQGPQVQQQMQGQPPMQGSRQQGQGGQQLTHGGSQQGRPQGNSNGTQNDPLFMLKK
jgi:hypothetical protein